MGANDALRRTVAGSTSTQSQMAEIERLIIDKANNDAQSLKMINDLQDKLKKARSGEAGNMELKRARKEYDALRQQYDKLQDAHTSMFGMDESTQKAAIDQLREEGPTGERPGELQKRNSIGHSGLVTICIQSKSRFLPGGTICFPPGTQTTCLIK